MLFIYAHKEFIPCRHIWLFLFEPTWIANCSATVKSISRFNPKIVGIWIHKKIGSATAEERNIRKSTRIPFYFKLIRPIATCKGYRKAEVCMVITGYIQITPAVYASNNIVASNKC